MSSDPIPNKDVRRALLSLNGLAPAAKADGLPVPKGPEPERTRGVVRRLGFVQVDSVSAVERAQNHILFTRNPRYRPEGLRHLLEHDRALFENWTHDAAILPIENYPYWKHFFGRQQRYEVHAGYRRYFAAVTPVDSQRILRRVKAEGPLGPRDFERTKVSWGDPSRRPTIAKLGFELLWRIGKLAVTRRESYQKIYDLSERVIPEEHYRAKVSKREYVEWACRGALERLGFATPTEIAHFYDAVSTRDAGSWCERARKRDLLDVRIEHEDGSTGKAFALAALIDALPKLPAAPRALRLLNPFDPLVRDRRRSKRVFGFDYTIEIWVPPKKRQYGYYVLPILEGDAFTGRVDLKVERKDDRLNVLGLWWERGVKPTRSRIEQLEGEIEKLARFTGVSQIAFPARLRRAGRAR